MGNRLTKITTRTGDDGSTGLGNGERVPKHGPRIAAIGDVDELNSTLGVLLAEDLPAPVRQCLTHIQHDLFDLGGELAIPGRTAVTAEHVTRLDRDIAAFNADLAPLKEFILPGGTRAAALAHVCRTVCRRAERTVIALDAATDGASDAKPNTSVEGVSASRLYLNRLSDLLFVLAREINHRAGHADVYWQSQRQSQR